MPTASGGYAFMLPHGLYCACVCASGAAGMAEMLTIRTGRAARVSACTISATCGCRRFLLAAATRRAGYRRRHLVAPASSAPFELPAGLEFCPSMSRWSASTWQPGRGTPARPRCLFRRGPARACQ